MTTVSDTTLSAQKVSRKRRSRFDNIYDMASCDEVNHPTSRKDIRLQIAASDFQDLKKYVVQDQYHIMPHTCDVMQNRNKYKYYPKIDQRHDICLFYCFVLDKKSKEQTTVTIHPNGGSYNITDYLWAYNAVQQ